MFVDSIKFDWYLSNRMQALECGQAYTIIIYQKRTHKREGIEYILRAVHKSCTIGLQICAINRISHKVAQIRNASIGRKF